MTDHKNVTIILLLCCLINPLISNSQGKTEWVVSSGSYGKDIINGLILDSARNLVIFGSNAAPPANGKSCFNGSGSQNFISQYDTSGKLLWNKNLLGEGNGYLKSVRVFSINNYIVSGNLSKTRNSKNIGYKTSTNFISCIDNQGNNIWTKSFKGSHLNFFHSIEINKSKEEIILSGVFQDTIEVEGKRFISSGKSDGIIAAFSKMGEVKNVITIGGKGAEQISFVEVTPEGGLLIIGIYEKVLNFGEKIIIQEEKQGKGIFLLILDKEGNCLRLSNIGWAANAEINSVIKNSEHYFISGSFTDKIAFNNNEVESEGNQDIFLVAFDNRFKLNWVKSLGGQRKEHTAGLVACSEGVVLTGSFLSNLEINDYLISPEKNSNDIFITKVDTNGKIKWFRVFGGPGNEYPQDIISDGIGNLFLVGQFNDSLLTPTKIVSLGNEDIFLAKLKDCDKVKLPFKIPEVKCPDKELVLDAGPGFISYDWDNGKSFNSSYTVNSDKSIPLRVTTNEGCVLFDTIIVSNAPIEDPFIGNDTCIVDTSVLILQCHGSYTAYQWSSGCRASDIIINGSDLREGPNVIWLTTTDVYGCEGYDDIVIDVVKPANSFHVKDLYYSIYPNPASDIINIELNQSFKKIIIKIFDISGKKILSTTLTDYPQGQIIKIPVSSLVPGIFTLLISTTEFEITHKIVHQ